MIPTIEEFTTWPWSAVALSSNGQRVVMGAQYRARAVDQSSGAVRWEVSLPQDNHKIIKQLAFVQNDERLAVAFRNAVEIWDSLTGRRLDVLVTNEAEINLVQASRDGTRLAVVGDKKNIQLWDVAKREVIREIANDPQYIYAIEFSPDANYLAVSGAPYLDSFVLWNLKTGNKTLMPARGARYFDGIASLAWSLDGKRFAARPQGREVLIYDVQTWKPIARWRGVGGDIAFTEDGTLLARLTDGSLRALYVRSLKPLVEH